MPPTTLTINRTTLAADLSGALFNRATGTFAVANLHFAKGSGVAACGVLLPPYDLRVTLIRLEAATSGYAPDRVVCLGDSFHDDGARDRMHEQDLAQLWRLTAGRDWIRIAGNHDPAQPSDIGGRALPELTSRSIVYRHESTGTDCGEIFGHFLPKARCHVRRRRNSERCFVSDGKRIVMLAFCAYAGELNVLDRSISSLYPDGFEVLMLGTKAYPPAGRTPARPCRQDPPIRSSPDRSVRCTAIRRSTSTPTITRTAICA